jgi:SH3 domain protein
MNMQKIKKRAVYNFLPGYFLSTILGLIVFSCSLTVNAAEYVYISDNLRVGVRTEPVSGVPPISVVFTGMRLEVHEKVDGYVKITTDKGVTGWIKDIYVTKKAPAIIQLNALRKKYDNLKKELSQGSDTSSMLEKANMALTDQLDELKAERREWSRDRVKIIASQYKESSWLWMVGILVLIVLSFAAGVFWYKNQVMKRLGGLKV